MKTQQRIYWATTGLFCLWMGLNAKAYLTSEQAKQLCAHFGFPDYFRIELAVAKGIGIAVLLLPFFGEKIKEWAYAGFTITVISGFIAHVCSGDSLLSSLSVLPALGLLAISYFTYHHLKSIQNESSSPVSERRNAAVYRELSRADS